MEQDQLSIRSESISSKTIRARTLSLNAIGYSITDTSSELHEAIRELIFRIGFEIVDTIYPSPGILKRAGFISTDGTSKAMSNKAAIFICVDLIPSQSDGLRFENGRVSRLRALPSMLRRIAAARGIDYLSSPVELFALPSSATTEKWVRSVRPAALTHGEEMLDEFIEHRTRFPLAIAKDLSNFCNNAYIWRLADGGVAKWFKPTRRRYFENELDFATACAGSDHVQRIEDVGDGWIVFRDLSSFKPLRMQVDRNGFLPLRLIKDVISAYSDIHARGFAHLDLHEGHVMSADDGGLVIIDYDRSCRIDPSLPLTSNPGLAGYDDPLAYDGPIGRTPSYRSVWARRAGTSLANVIAGRTALPNLLRTARTINRKVRTKLKYL